MSDLNSGKGVRVGTWNLERGKPLWRRPLQAAHLADQADVWLLTEVPSDCRQGNSTPSFSALLADETDQHWAAITSTWPMAPIASKHPTLAMARIDHPDGSFLAASSVFPWRGAAKFWPTGDGNTFAERCAGALEAHATAIENACGALPVVWGGDFNQALSGPESVGSGPGRCALLEAFMDLKLQPVTIQAEGQDPLQGSIDHIAIPAAWSSGGVKIQRPQPDGRPLSDHPSYVVSVERDV